jgi:hypothetical protein
MLADRKKLRDARGFGGGAFDYRACTRLSFFA